MYKVKNTKKIEGQTGEIEIVLLTENGKETTERMVLPVTIEPGATWDQFPGKLSKDAVSFLLHEIMLEDED